MSIGHLWIQGHLLLALGQPTQVPFYASDVWVADPSVLKAQAVANDLILSGLRKGRTHLTGVSKSGTPVQAWIVDSETLAGLQKCPNLPLSWDRFPPQFTGTERDLSKLKSCGVLSLAAPAHLDEALSNVLLATLSSLNRQGQRPQLSRGPDLRYRVDLDGSTTVTVPQVQKLLGVYSNFVDVRVQSQRSTGRSLSFELTLFEFSRSRAEALGVRWPDSVRIQVLDGARFSPKVQGGLVIGGDFGESAGVGRVLAQPTLRTTVGERARFQSGGQFPVKTSSGLTSKTEWKDYGLIVDITPASGTARGSGEIEIDLDVEFSIPDASLAAEGTPGLTTRKLRSKFDLQEGEVTVLSTMVQSQQNRGRSGLPGLSALPGLGSLFGTKVQSESDVELWFAIKPAWEEISLERFRKTVQSTLQ